MNSYVASFINLREISEHRLGPAEWALHVDDPFSFAQRRQISCEGFCIDERSMVAEEQKLLVRRDDPLQEQPAEQAREHAHRQEEARPARHPTRAIERDATAWHDQMHMGMMGQRRAPAVQHRSDADAGTEPLGIGRDRERGLGRCLEQQVVDHGLVLIGDAGDRTGQREHKVEVAYGQQATHGVNKVVVQIEIIAAAEARRHARRVGSDSDEVLQ